MVPFNGEPRHLGAEITEEEVEKAVQNLAITGEYFKYGTKSMSEPIARMFNNMF